MRSVSLVEVSCDLPDATTEPYIGTIEVKGPGILNLSIDSSTLPPGLRAEANGSSIRVSGASDLTGELRIEPDKSNLEPGGQPSVSVTFPNLSAQNPEAGELTGTLRLKLKPSEGLPGGPGVTDATFGFINGSNEIPFRIDTSEGPTRGNAIFESGSLEAAFQVGTLAGDILMTAVLDSGNGLGRNFAFPVFVKDEVGNQLQPIPECAIRIAPSGALIQKVPQVAPAIASAGIERTAGEYVIHVVGYSTPREINRLTIEFTPVPGGTISPRSLQVPLNTLSPSFLEYFGGPQAVDRGGMFQLRLRLAVSGDASAISQLSVTLDNGRPNPAPRPNHCTMDFQTGSPAPGQICMGMSLRTTP